MILFVGVVLMVVKSRTEGDKKKRYKETLKWSKSKTLQFSTSVEHSDKKWLVVYHKKVLILPDSRMV